MYSATTCTLLHGERRKEAAVAVWHSLTVSTSHYGHERGGMGYACLHLETAWELVVTSVYMCLLYALPFSTYRGGIWEEVGGWEDFVDLGTSCSSPPSSTWPLTARQLRSIPTWLTQQTLPKPLLYCPETQNNSKRYRGCCPACGWCGRAFCYALPPRRWACLPLRWALLWARIACSSL